MENYILFAYDKIANEIGSRPAQIKLLMDEYRSIPLKDIGFRMPGVFEKAIVNGLVILSAAILHMKRGTKFVVSKPRK